MVVIAYNYEGQIISIVNATDEKTANAYWMGANIIPHSTKVLERDFTPISEHPYGVFPILKTEKKSLSAFGNNPHDYIIVSKH